MVQLLSPERVAIADTEASQHVEASVRKIEIAPEPTTPAQELLQSIRIGWRGLAGETAQNIQSLSQATVEQALEIGQNLCRMQRELKKKEYSTFLSLLGWASAKARKFINLAKVFAGFQPSQLISIEITTLLNLCSSRYSMIVEQLRDAGDITQQLVEQLIKEARKPRASKQDPISGWKSNRAGGGRRYQVSLHDEKTGLSIEQQAYSEGILPQKVIAEAVALRAQHKTLAQPDESSAVQSERLPAMIERSPSPENSTLGKELLSDDHAAPTLKEIPPENEVESASDELGKALEVQVAVLAPAETTEREHEVKATEANNSIQEQILQAGDLVEINAISPNGDKTWNRMKAYVQRLVPTTGKAVVLLQGDYRSKHFGLDSLKLVQENEANLSDTLRTSDPESVKETSTTAISQSDELSESTESLTAFPGTESAQAPKLTESAPTTTGLQDTVASDLIEQAPQLEEGATADATDCQVITPPWSQIKQLRDAESRLRPIDTQIQKLNSKLADSGSDPVVEREITPVLKKQLDLRSTKVSQIVELIDSGGLSAYYEEYQGFGRVILDSKYLSELLLQARSWADIALVVKGDRAQLVNAVADWTLELKLNLVQLLSVYLKTEPNALGQIDWIPKKLLEKALLSLSFTLQKLKKTDNLVDEPEFENIRGCLFRSVANIGTPKEQWFFQVGGKVLDVFGRSGFTVEKF